LRSSCKKARPPLPPLHLPSPSPPTPPPKLVLNYSDTTFLTDAPSSEPPEFKGNATDLSRLAFKAFSSIDHAWCDVASLLSYRVNCHGELKKVRRYLDEEKSLIICRALYSIALEQTSCHHNLPKREEKKKKKETNENWREEPNRKEKKKCKKCQKAKPKSRFYNPTNHGKEYKYYNCLVTRKASCRTERHDHALYFLICLGKSKFVEIVLQAFRVQFRPTSM
ncbi:uncharacterized protein LOC111456335, partial [Cucurbita moschata]|uniref:Uncharacterized protein LOC111456335 n=1 Tax=Cucurbita moschata TaxID=3662 RepID=A0A6J1GPP3_CUCMO